jgi:hypothetical protein
MRVPEIPRNTGRQTEHFHYPMGFGARADKSARRALVNRAAFGVSTLRASTPGASLVRPGSGCTPTLARGGPSSDSYRPRRLGESPLHDAPPAKPVNAPSSLVARLPGRCAGSLLVWVDQTSARLIFRPAWRLERAHGMSPPVLATGIRPDSAREVSGEGRSITVAVGWRRASVFRSFGVRAGGNEKAPVAAWVKGRVDEPRGHLS